MRPFLPQEKTILGLITKARNKERARRDHPGRSLTCSVRDEIGRSPGLHGFKRKHGLVDYDDLLFLWKNCCATMEPGARPPGALPPCHGR
jgi:DNA helicase-2/ATP-dependent DNA helicase PcrA